MILKRQTKLSHTTIKKTSSTKLLHEWLPTVPKRLNPGRLTDIIGEVSVNPYPSYSVNPNASKYSNNAGSSLAPPMKISLWNVYPFIDLKGFDMLENQKFIK